MWVHKLKRARMEVMTSEKDLLTLEDFRIPSAHCLVLVIKERITMLDPILIFMI